MRGLENAKGASHEKPSVFQRVRAWLRTVWGKALGRQPDSEEKTNLWEQCLARQLDKVSWVRTRRAGEDEEELSGNSISSDKIARLIDQTLDGQYVYLAVDFVIQGEGIYVKRLDKTVYRPYHSTLVIHQGDGKLACLFFSGKSLCCYRLIADFYAYTEIDSEELRSVSVGGATLTEYVVFRGRGKIDEALCQLFANFEDAEEWLGRLGSGLWSVQNAFPGGKNNYEKMREEQGLLERV